MEKVGYEVCEADGREGVSGVRGGVGPGEGGGIG